MKSADVTREWPDHVLVSVEERVAVAVVSIGGRIRGMDEAGVVFRDYARAPAGLPQVRTSTDTRSDALQEAARVVGALPVEVSRLVDHVAVETVDQISLVLRDGRTVVWGSADESGPEGEGAGGPAAAARQDVRRQRPRPAHHRRHALTLRPEAAPSTGQPDKKIRPLRDTRACRPRFPSAALPTVFTTARLT